jgi:hypothetical protein
LQPDNSLPTPPTLQVAVELEGDARPRRLSVVIRRVDIIPIASLQAFMVGGQPRCPAPSATPQGSPFHLTPQSVPPLSLSPPASAPQKGQDEELAYHAIQVRGKPALHRRLSPLCLLAA